MKSVVLSLCTASFITLSGAPDLEGNGGASVATQAMVDPFELWRLAWASAVSRGFDRLADIIPGAAVQGTSLVPSALPVFGRVRLDLATMLLLEERELAVPRTATALIVAPFAVHEASIADFAEGHSLAQALAEGGAGPLALTYWKSATADMRDYGIDAYLGDLNIAIDDLGGRVSLVGLCQGGWLAAAYAARFRESREARAGRRADRPRRRRVRHHAPLGLRSAGDDRQHRCARRRTHFRISVCRLMVGRPLAGIHCGIGAAMRRRSGDDGEVQRVEPAHRRSSGRLLRADRGMDLSREPARARALSRVRPAGRAHVYHGPDFCSCRGGRRGRVARPGDRRPIPLPTDARRDACRTRKAPVAVHGPQDDRRRLAGGRALARGEGGRGVRPRRPKAGAQAPIGRQLCAWARDHDPSVALLARLIRPIEATRFPVKQGRNRGKRPAAARF